MQKKIVIWSLQDVCICVNILYFNKGDSYLLNAQTNKLFYGKGISIDKFIEFNFKESFSSANQISGRFSELLNAAMP